jgi:hypothetical protein
MNKRAPLIVVGLALLALGVLFSRWTDVASASVEQGAVARAREKAKALVYPRDRIPARRLAERATSDPQRVPRQQAASDPIQRAMSFPAGGAVFVEVNAIRHSELAEKILRCSGEEGEGQLSRMKDELGIDPLEDLDRVAMHKDVLAASGNLGGLKLPPEASAPEAYGESAQLYEWPSTEEAGAHTFMARVGEDLLLLGSSPEELKAAVDRAEGRGPPPPPMPAHLADSEIYGSLGPGLLALFAGPEGDSVLGKLDELVTGGTVRVLVADHVSLSLDLEAKSQDEADDLAKALGGALAAMRQQAKASGEHELAALLEHSRVLPQGGGRFGLDVAVPGELILKGMGCGRDDDAQAPQARE